MMEKSFLIKSMLSLLASPLCVLTFIFLLNTIDKSNSLLLRQKTLIGNKNTFHTFNQRRMDQPVFSTYRVNFAEPAQRGRSQRLFMAKDEGPGSSSSFLTTFIVISVLVVYVGTLLLPGIQETSNLPTATVTIQESDGTTKTVGKYTGMTKLEINRKISQIPVFFLENSAGGVALVDGEGRFYTTLAEAKQTLETLKKSDPELYGGVRVSGVTLDQVWYPLIEKRAKIGSFIQGVVGESDAQAPYRLISGSKQNEQAERVNSIVDISGSPLFFSKRVQFQGKTAGSKNQIPLFLEYEDLETTWSRLRKSNPSLPVAPEVELTSLKAILNQMEKGGTEFARQYEFYPSIVQIDGINELYGLSREKVPE